MKQIKIEEDGKWKTTVNLNDAGKVIREWGDGDDIDKIVIVKKPPKEDVQRQIDELEELIELFDESILDDDVPQPTPQELQDEIKELKKLL